MELSGTASVKDYIYSLCGSSYEATYAFWGGLTGISVGLVVAAIALALTWKAFGKDEAINDFKKDMVRTGALLLVGLAMFSCGLVIATYPTYKKQFGEIQALRAQIKPQGTLEVHLNKNAPTIRFDAASHNSKARLSWSMIVNNNENTTHILYPLPSNLESIKVDKNWSLSTFTVEPNAASFEIYPHGIKEVTYGVIVELSDDDEETFMKGDVPPIWWTPS